MSTWEERMSARAKVRQETGKTLEDAWFYVANATRPVGTTRPLDPTDPYDGWFRLRICPDCHPGFEEAAGVLAWDGRQWVSQVAGEPLRVKPGRPGGPEQWGEARWYLDLPHVGGEDRELRCQCLCHWPIALAG